MFIVQPLNRIGVRSWIIVMSHNCTILTPLNFIRGTICIHVLLKGICNFGITKYWYIRLQNTHICTIIFILQVNEGHLFAKMDYECRMNGAEFLAYPPVVAGKL